jgi:integrase
MKTSEGLSLWLEHRNALSRLSLCAPSTVKNQSKIIIILKSWLGHYDLDKLRKSHLEIYVGERLQKAAPITVRGELNVLRQALAWLVDEEHMPTRPKMPRLSVPQDEEDMPSDAAFDWMLAHLPPCHSRALELMMIRGLSPHEIERLEVQDLASRTSQASEFPPPRKIGKTAHLGIGQRPDFSLKNGARKRWISMSGRALDIWIESTMGMQSTTRPFPTVEAMEKAFQRARPAPVAYIEYDPLFGPPIMPPPDVHKITPKMGRKWFASKMSAPGEDGQPVTPEHVLQRIMGHARGSPITRRHYIGSTAQQCEDAVKDLRI